MASLTTRVLIALNGVISSEWFQAGGALIKPGYVVTEDDADEVKICGTSDLPYGVAGCPAYHDLNTVFSAGERVPVYLIGSGVEVYVLHDGAAAASLVKGSRLMRSATTAGNVSIGTAWSAPDTTTYATGDFTEDMMTSHFDVGTCNETLTIVSGTAAYVSCVLSVK